MPFLDPPNPCNPWQEISLAEDGYCLISPFLSSAETARWLSLVEARRDLFKAISGKAGMTLPYNVVDGLTIDQHFPELRALAAGPLLKVAAETFGVQLELMGDPKRALRIQYYRQKQEGFKWHLDGSLYSVVLTLLNTNDGATEILSPEWSRVLFPVPYLLFPFGRLLELTRPRLVTGRPGDLLLIRGGEILHRGINRKDGERIIFAVSYSPLGTRPNRLWAWFARQLNY